MAEDLQNLLEKINREGVEKARAAAEEIVSEAKAKAAAIVNDARAQAEATRAAAERDAQASAERAAETIRQAARDTIIKVEGSVTAMMTGLLTKNVETALRDEKTIGALVAEAVRGIAGVAEVAVPAALAPAIRAQLAANANITVTTDEAIGTGFSVRLDGGRVEHTFTGKAVADELARRLRPELAKLVRGE